MQPLAHQNGVLEVVPAPRHEGHDDVLAQGQLPVFGGRTVGDNLSLADHLAVMDQGALVKAGVLVRALEFGQAVDGHRRNFQLAGDHIADHDPGGVHLLDQTVMGGDHRDARILGHHLLDSGAHQRCFGRYQRHGLALHVGPHQGPVGIVVFQKGNQGGGYAHQLIGRNVHQLDILPPDHHEFTGNPRGHQGVDVIALLVHGRIGLGNGVLLFLEGAEEFDLF
jgi:hypothetical protein